MEWFALLVMLFLPAKPGRPKPGPGPSPEPDPEPGPAPQPMPDGGEVEDVDPPTPDDEGEGEKPYVPQPGMSPLWPVPKSARRWRSTSFGSARPWKSPNPTRHHSGIDIRAKQGDPVLAPDGGTVIDSTGWRGANTRAVLLQMDGGPVLVFGAVAPGSYPLDGTRVERGEQIATIGKYPGGSQMLHLEVYQVGTTKRKPWYWGKPQPSGLINPTNYLQATVKS